MSGNAQAEDLSREVEKVAALMVASGDETLRAQARRALDAAHKAAGGLCPWRTNVAIRTLQDLRETWTA